RLDLSVEQGSNTFYDAANRMPTNYAKDASGAIITYSPTASEEARGTPIWRTGRTQRYDLAASGGTGTITYRLSGNFLDDQGVDWNNEQRQSTSRANVAFQPRPSFSVRLDAGIVNGKTTLMPQEGIGPIQGVFRANPLLQSTITRGFGFGIPPDV